MWDKSQTKAEVNTNGASLGKLVVEIQGDDTERPISRSSVSDSTDNSSMPQLTKEVDLEESTGVQDENENTPQVNTFENSPFFLELPIMLSISQIIFKLRYSFVW